MLPRASACGDTVPEDRLLDGQPMPRFRRQVSQVRPTSSEGSQSRGEVAVNRKLIRPNLTELKEQGSGKPVRRRPVPPEQTNAESFYYIKQMNNKTPMVLVLKHNIKYMYKESEGKNGD